MTEGTRVDMAMGSKMRAVGFCRYGPPEVMEPASAWKACSSGRAVPTSRRWVPGSPREG